MNTRSIQFRLILWSSGLVILVLLAFGYYTYAGVRSQLYGDLEHTLSRRAHQITVNILPHAVNQSSELAEQIHDVYSPEANNRFIRITDAGHKVIYVSGAPQDGRFNPANIPPANDHPAPMRLEALSYHDDMLITATQAQVDGAPYLIEMGIPTEEVDQTLHGLIFTLLWGLPIVILIVSAGGYALVKRALHPVDRIAATAQQITFGNLSNRLPIATTGDAIEHLSVTLNKMLDRLEHAYEQASRFSADASHELRTPLTIMRGELESLARIESMPNALQERIGSVLEETERLSRITESLFTISRLDAGEAKMEHERLDLAKLVTTTAEQMQLLADEKRLTLDVDANTTVMVKGDQTRLKQVVVNLLDNAIKYTPTGGKVSLQVYARRAVAYVEIQDTGEGIAEDALPHVFERFYRTDKARSQDVGGAGLGLSIVRSICEAHGGKVDIRNNVEHGITCLVELPLANNGAGE